MSFIEVVDRVVELLRHRGRVSYRVLKREFDLSEDDLEDLKVELIAAARVAADEDGKVLVWTGDTAKEETENRRSGEPETSKTTFPDARRPTLDQNR
jgi:hypothetical protein